MYYSYAEIEYVATSFSPTRMDLAVKLFCRPLMPSTPTLSSYCLGTFDGIVKKNTPRKLFFFFDHQPVPLCCTYVLCTQGHHNILLIEDLVRLRAEKHKPTMMSAASPRATNPKMVESPARMAHALFSYACTEDGYFKRPHTASIDGDIQLDSCWFFVGFGVGGHLTRD
jgi:hypothetical protein